jgi:RNA polymerase sigma-70 factor (ECF subfamily)
MNGARREEIEKQLRFEEFFRAHYDRVEQYVSRRVPNSRVDDVVGATFAVAWRKFTKVESPSLPWLFRIASFEIKSSSRVARRSDVVLSPEVFETKWIESNEVFDGTPVLAAMAQLSEVDREILQLVHWDDLTRHEVAEVLNLTVSASNMRYHRALSRLEQMLSPKDNPTQEGVRQ